MKQLKKEMNEIIIRITEEELTQNIKITEERIMNKKIKEELNSIVKWIEKEEENKNMRDIHMTNIKINNSWIDEQEIEHETIEERRLKIIHKQLKELINLMRERDELYKVTLAYMLQNETENIEQRNEINGLTLAYMLQDETKKIEELIKQLERNHYYETQKGEDYNTVHNLFKISNWIEEEQEKFKI